MTPSELMSRPFTLPNGSVIPNRFAKSAMSETLGSIDNHPTKELITLYRAWADGGAGLSITGNVMIDRRHIGEPQNVVVEDEADLDLLKSWARAGRGGGKQIWMQLNHPGKQSPKMLNRDPVSPSAIPFKKDLRGMFATPRALTGPEIDDIIRRFAQAAAVASQNRDHPTASVCNAHAPSIDQAARSNRVTPLSCCRDRQHFVLDTWVPSICMCIGADRMTKSGHLAPRTVSASMLAQE